MLCFCYTLFCDLRYALTDLPTALRNPSIPEPDPAPAPASDFSHLLQPLMRTHIPEYIPKHFPQLPPQHAWKQTSVFPKREHGAQLRERAMEEGIQAELALRKLAAAAKSGQMREGKFADVRGDEVFKDMLLEA